MHRLAFPHGRVVFVQGLLVARGIPVDQRVRGITRRQRTEKVDEAVIGIKEGKAFLSTSRPDLEFGYKTMKLFPAGCAPKGYLKALKGPYDEANYIAIGGVTIDNINDYFKEGYMGVGLASNLMPLSVLKDKNWDLGVSYVQKYVSRVKRRV